MAKQTMATGAQINQGDGDKDAVSLSIASNVLRSLDTAVTKAMTTAITSQWSLSPSHPRPMTYSSAIDPYDNTLLEMKTKVGRYWCHPTTIDVNYWVITLISPW